MESYINIDKNMLVAESISGYDVLWYDVRKEPFSLHGFYEPLTEPFFRRVKPDVAEAASEGVDKLSRESAGGRVRFSTDSSYIAVRAKYRVVGRSSHLNLVSTSGFDLYTDGEFGSRYIKEFRMPYDMKDSYEALVPVVGGVMRSYTINFPVHAVVESLEIGLSPDAKLDFARPYRDIKPVIFYGSSIVHGTAASRPGTIYPAIISRDLNLDFRNIGFSGMAKAEPVLGEWLATLPMSVFVYDYDHNSPDLDHLRATHYPFYEIIREKNPDVPVIMITRPDYWTYPTKQEHILQRRDIIMESYLKARSAGDINVYFIDGLSFFAADHQYEHSLDGVHPNDFGFVRMAQVIGITIRHALENSGVL